MDFRARDTRAYEGCRLVILSVAKNLLLCEFLLTEILRCAQDDSAGGMMFIANVFQKSIKNSARMLLGGILI